MKRLIVASLLPVGVLVCLRGGWWIVPSKGWLRWSRAMRVPKGGQVAAQDLVPSIGSSTQADSSSVRSAPDSSAWMPWLGERLAPRGPGLRRAGKLDEGSASASPMMCYIMGLVERFGCTPPRKRANLSA